MACSYFFNAKARLACSTEVSIVTFGAAGALLSGICRYTMVEDHSGYLRSHFRGFEISYEDLWKARGRVGAVNGEKVSHK